MDTKDFKELFSRVAERNGFAPAFGGWFSESPECIQVIDLQKSNFGNYYEMNFKIFVRGMFGNIWLKNKGLVKKEIGNVLKRPPKDFGDVFNLDAQFEQAEREQRLSALFNDLIVPVATQASTRAGLLKLGEAGQIFLLPAVEAELKGCRQWPVSA
jgi:hypothetical protein